MSKFRQRSVAVLTLVGALAVAGVGAAVAFETTQSPSPNHEHSGPPSPVASSHRAVLMPVFRASSGQEITMAPTPSSEPG